MIFPLDPRAPAVPRAEALVEGVSRAELEAGAIHLRRCVSDHAPAPLQGFLLLCVEQLECAALSPSAPPQEVGERERTRQQLLDDVARVVLAVERGGAIDHAGSVHEAVQRILALVPADVRMPTPPRAGAEPTEACGAVMTPPLNGVPEDWTCVLPRGHADRWHRNDLGQTFDAPARASEAASARETEDVIGPAHRPASEAVKCDVCPRTDPHIHCPECGSTEHVASECDMMG